MSVGAVTTLNKAVDRPIEGLALNRAVTALLWVSVVPKVVPSDSGRLTSGYRLVIPRPPYRGTTTVL